MLHKHYSGEHRAQSAKDAGRRRARHPEPLLGGGVQLAQRPLAGSSLPSGHAALDQGGDVRQHGDAEAIGRIAGAGGEATEARAASVEGAAQLRRAEGAGKLDDFDVSESPRIG